MAPVVSVEGLRKRYRRRDAWAVDGVTFALEPGQAFGLLGPNGAGKSTVVKIIAGLLRADEGKVELFGSDPGNPTSRKDLGFAPEDPDFPKFLRAGEVLDYFASLLGLDEPTAALDPLGRRDVRALIDRLKDSGVAVLLNSHLLSEVELVCDTVAILGKGRVLKEGTMAEVVPDGRTLEDVFVELVEATSTAPKR